MSQRLSAAAGALLFSASACTGQAFDAVSGDGGRAADGGPLAPAEAGPARKSDGSRRADAARSSDGRVEPHPLDGRAEDSAVPGGPDGSTDAAGPPLAAWCDGKSAAFCLHFDHVRAVADGWTSFDVTPGAGLEFNLLAFTSPARSMRSRVPKGSGLNTAISVVRKAVASSLGRSVLEFDCNVASIATTPAGWLLQIARLGRNSSEDAVGLYAHSTGTWSVVVDAGAAVLAYELPAPPAYGRFVRVSVDVLWSATAGSVHLAFDGQSVLSENGLVTALNPVTKTIELSVGLADATGATPAADVSFDNVVLQQH